MRRYAEWVIVDAQYPKYFGLPNPAESPRTSTGETVLRVLRVGLHIGFAILLVVGVARLLSSGPDLVRGIIAAVLAFLLAALHLAGTVQDNRDATGRAPGTVPWAKWWLGGVVVLWLVLVSRSASAALAAADDEAPSERLVTIGATASENLAEARDFVADLSTSGGGAGRLGRFCAAVERIGAAAGHGFAGLRERLELLGGTLEIESSPGEGTALAVRVPYTIEESQGR